MGSSGPVVAQVNDVSAECGEDVGDETAMTTPP